MLSFLRSTSLLQSAPFPNSLVGRARAARRRLAAGLGAGLLLAGAGLGLPAPAQAQSPTPNATVENGGGTVRWQSFYGGGLLAPSTFGPTSPNDSIPATGAGTRLMWYPAKAAFRAGRVGVTKDGTQWDAVNVGRYSVAFGADTKASGTHSVAMGEQTTASDFAAMAMGFRATASGTNATAIGRDTKASLRGATAMGEGTTASNSWATAMGEGTTAEGLLSTALGNDTNAKGISSTSMGEKTVAASRASVSLGVCNSSNTSSDNSLLVVGNGNFQGGCDTNSDALVLDQSGNLTISGGLTENSDRRLKKQIEPLGEGILRKLADLRPVRYEFKDQQTHPSGTQLGLIAQDVRTEFPALVSEGADGMLSLAYPKLTAVLLKGIQEQQSTIDEQKGRIAALEAENDQIKKRLAALEAERSGALPAGLTGPWALALLARRRS